MINQTIRAVVRGGYDIQKLRIQAGNRIVGNFKVKLGQAPGKREDALDAEGKAILAQVRSRYKAITDGIADMPSLGRIDAPQLDIFGGDPVISDYTELCLVDYYMTLAAAEARHAKNLKRIVHGQPIWTDWLESVKGIGELMAGVIISEIDIHKARYVSSLWKYAGLDVGPDGAGRSRKEAHLIDREYVDKHGEKAIRRSITFNPFLKTKLLGVLGPSFLKHANERYAPVYRNYKHRLESHEKYGDARPARRHNMAMRYMVKIFLADLYVAWRRLEGLAIAEPYQEAKLGMRHEGAA